MNQAIDSRDILFPDQFIEMEVEDAGSTGIYQTQVKAILGGQILTTLPSPLPDGSQPAEGMPLKLRVHLRRGVFVLKARVAGIERGHPDLLAVREEGEWERIQRRWDVRLSIVFPPQKTVLVENDETRPFDATVLDISGGGLLLQCKRRIPEGARLHISMELPNQPPCLDVEAEVLRVTSHQEFGWGYYRLGVRFLELPARDKDRIVRFIFREEARRRSVGRR